MEKSGSPADDLGGSSMECGYYKNPELSHLLSSSSASRFIQSDMAPVEVSTSHTVASLFLGEGSQAEHIMFLAGVKSKPATACLWVLWVIGAVVGLLVVQRSLPLDFVWVSLLMLPLPVVTLLLLSVDLLKEFLTSVDLLVIFLLQIALFLDGMFYCRGDIRRVFWWCYLPSMIASGLIDAYPAKYRAFFAKLFYTAALLILVIWNCLLIFRWQVFAGSTMAILVHHASDQLTLLAFYCRHLWCSIYRPDHFVMITASVCTQRGSGRRQSMPNL